MECYRVLVLQSPVRTLKISLGEMKQLEWSSSGSLKHLFNSRCEATVDGD